ncbi:MAG: type II toxin-antitoxin system HicB family antitoxin, partial [Candidatus Cloacimonetes bacterium]|nr:type II toxin-antitoxin system HicB family antitoxin [Candidatus Cloacimonadota bacterium]
MRNIRFLAVIKPAEEGGFYAYCPLLPGCASQGETYAETVANIQDA